MGIGCLGLTFFVFDFASMGPVLSLQSVAHLGLVLSALDSARVESSMSIRSLVRMGLTLFLNGTLRLDVVTELSVVGACSLELSLFMQSFTCVGSASFTLDLVSIAFLILPQNLARSEPSIFVLGMSCMSSLVSIVDYTQLDSMPSMLGSGEGGSSLFVLSNANLGFPPLPRSSARLESPASALSVVLLDSSLSLRNLG